jgi:hypothetical protein
LNGVCVCVRRIHGHARCFVIDTLNFSFWPSGGHHFTVTGGDGVQYTGYYSLCAAVNAAIESGYMDIIDARAYSNIDVHTLTQILTGDDGAIHVS